MRKVSCGDYRKGWISAITLAVLLFLLTAGCGMNSTLVKQGEKLEPHAGLLAGFNQYWTARATKEADASFKQEAAYIQEMVSLETYRLYLHALTRKAELVKVEILGMECEQPFLCFINCRLTYKADGREEERDLRDCWVEVDGRWFHVVKNPMIFPQLGAGSTMWTISCKHATRV